MSAMIDYLSAHATLILLIAVAVIVVAMLQRVPVVGRFVSLAVMAVSLAFVVLLIGQRAHYDPAFARIADTLHLGERQQEAVGKELRVPMASDGHFWVRVKIGQIERRMLVDSGATVTAISSETATAAGLSPDDAPFPIEVRTANGAVAAQTATLPEIRIGNVVARNLPVVVSPAFGDTDVIGMNLLSRLKSWRVEGRTMVLVPHHPVGVAEATTQDREAGSSPSPRGEGRKN